MNQTASLPAAILHPQELETLFAALRDLGYRIIGPTVRDQTIIYDELEGPMDLPQGWGDEQTNGRYRLVKRGDNAFFAYSVGPTSLKNFLFPPHQPLFSSHEEEGRLVFQEEKPVVPRYAFLGVRPCELAAIAVKDRVFTGGPFPEVYYQARRQDNFIVAVNCATPASTCFCGSMGTGPQAEDGYDLAITELLEPEHLLLIKPGSEKGMAVLTVLPTQPASENHVEQAAQVSRHATNTMGRFLETDGLKEALYSRYEDPHWADIATRCLSCANCTMVCPTCFCTTVEDVTDLSGLTATRSRLWDSCFTNSFTYIHGGSVRDSTRVRYRQWLTHKLGTWVDQFGSFGCVGCGRCITWCPVGIDITAEANALVNKAALESKENHDGRRTHSN